MVNENGTWQENEDGTWSVAIPEPYFVGWRLKKALCDCGLTFKNRDLYREHYRTEHTDGKKYGRTPKGLVEL